MSGRGHQEAPVPGHFLHQLQKYRPALRCRAAPTMLPPILCRARLSIQQQYPQHDGQGWLLIPAIQLAT